MKSEYQLNRLRSRRLSQLALHDNPPNHAHVSGLPLVWYIKWVSSNNMYPYYMYVQSIGVALWLIVSFMWNDKALIVVNAIGLAVIINGIVKYLTLSP
jgi:ABC-type siderophore export system fused ATPase/permease subunit